MKLPKVSAGVRRIGAASRAKSQYLMLSAWRGISIGDILDPIDIRGKIEGKKSNISSSQAQEFAACMGFPNTEEASQCLGAVAACFVTVIGGPIPYGACVGTACGIAGAKHAYRCAQQAGIISGGGSSGGVGGGGSSSIRRPPQMLR